MSPRILQSPALLIAAVASVALIAACGRDAPRGAKAPATTATPAVATLAATATAAPAVAATTASPPTAPASALTPPPATKPIRIDALLQPAAPVEAIVHIEAATRNERADLTVVARLSKPGAHDVHIHDGSCRAPSLSLGDLGTLRAGADGRDALKTSVVLTRNGVTPITFDLIASRELIIDIHDPSGVVVACAEFPRGGQQ